MRGAGPGSAGARPRFTVIRGTYQANLPELTVFSRLAEHGYSPELLGARRTAYRDEEVGMPVRRLATPAVGGRLSRNLAIGFLIGQVSPYRYHAEYLRGFDRAVRGSAVLCPVDLGHPTSYQAVAHRPEIPVVVQCWDNIPFNWPFNRPLAEHYQAVLDRARLFLPFSRMADWALAREGVAAERRVQIYCGLDLERHRPPTPEERRRAREGLGAKEGDCVVVFVGRLVYGKGIFTLLEAMPGVDPSVRLELVGNGPERGRAETLARRLGVSSRVRFHGRVPHGEVQRRFLWGADLFVMPSIPTPQWREQLPQTVVEAMAAGVPVLASRTGSIPEVVDDGVTGSLLPPDLPEEWAGAILRMAGDAPLRERMGRAGRERAMRSHDARVSAALLSEALRQRGLGPA
jgi:glycosyltransferase involved in cell wall biosynthesis